MPLRSQRHGAVRLRPGLSNDGGDLRDLPLIDRKRRLLQLIGKTKTRAIQYGDHLTGDGPAIFVILIAGFIVVGAALIVEMAYQPPFWMHAVLWGPLILIVTLLPLRIIKGLLIVLQYHHAATEGRLERLPK